MKRNWKFWASALGLGIIALLIAALFLAPRLWSGSCGEHCERSLDSIALGPSGFTLRGLRLRSGEANGERWEITAGAIELKPYWLKVLTGQAYFHEITATNLSVILSEGDAPKIGSSEGLPLFHVDSLRAVGARFTYRRLYRGRRGALSFSEINLNAAHLGTDFEFIDREATAILSARMENSGEVSIDLRARFFQPDPQMAMRLVLKGQNLGEANAYFRPIDEIELKGNLLEAATETRWVKNRLTSSVALRFRDFGVDFHGGKERSGLAAFFGDLLGKAAFRERSGAGFLPGYAAIERLPKESPVGFALRGLKEAAMKAAQQ